MKVVWLIQNLTPYHHARFEAFTTAFGGRAYLIQVTDKDDFGVLQYQPKYMSYELMTLAPGECRSTVSEKRLRLSLNDCLAEIEPDCVCVSGWGMVIGQALQWWALKHHVPMVLFSESTAYDMERANWKEWIKSWLVRVSSSALVGGAPHRDYIQRLGMTADSVFLGHNVVDSAHFSQKVDKRPLGLPDFLDQIPFFTACTRFGQKKNIPGLVRAFASYDRMCREEGLKSWRLVIAGDGDLRKEIEQTIVSTNMTEKVILLGAISYELLPWLYQHAQAFVHASTTEQWGLVVNEAMAAGSPVLVSRQCGCAPDLVHNGVNGFQFDPYSEEEICKTLHKFHMLPAETKVTFGQKSREIIADWGPNRFAKGLAQAIDKALVVGPKRNTMVARILLWLLLLRGME